MFYGNQALIKVDIVDGNIQSLGDTTSKVKQQPDKEPIPQVSGGFFQFLYLLWFKICLIHE
jgi:hypothetical protein